MLKKFGHFENILMPKKIEQFGNFLPDNVGQIMKKKKNVFVTAHHPMCSLT
jgi:hypothetical protein